MTKESNLLFTFIKSFGSYIALALIIELSVEIFVSNPYLKDFSQLIGSIIFIALGYSIYRKKINGCFKNFVKDFKDNWLKILLVSGGLILLEVILAYILGRFGISSTNQAEAVKEVTSSSIPKIIYLAVLGTICEEICFRLPYSFCNNKNKLLTYIFFSLVFASVHLLLIQSLAEALYFIPYLCLSFGIGFGFYKTDNILMSTIVHIINNSLSIMLILL